MENKFKVGDWVRINVEKFSCSDWVIKSFYRDRVVKIRGFYTSGIAVLETPSFYKDRQWAGLGTYCLELVKKPNQQLTFIFQE
jgi:hypothetical protein